MTTTTGRPGCLTAFLQWLGLAPKPRRETVLPYHLRDDFLSRAEPSFYHVLRITVTDWAVVCPKVSLGDLFFAQTGDYGRNRSWMNRIDRKHVDFLLCDPKTMRPLLGVELDDASHQQQKRIERDRFVEQVFAAAGLPLARVLVRTKYSTRELDAYLRGRIDTHEPAPDAVTSPPAAEPESAIPQSATSDSSPLSPPCPKCGAPMVMREVAKEGPHKGNRFWGCPNFPRCRGIRELRDTLSEQPSQV